MSGMTRQEAVAAVSGAQAALQAVAGLLEEDGPTALPGGGERAVMNVLSALEAARTAQRHTSRTIEAIMELLADAGVPWPQMGIYGPGDE